MRILEVNKQYLELVGILTKNGERRKTIDKILKYLINFILVIGTLFSLSVCSAAYIYQNPTDLSGVINAFLNFFAGLSTFGAYMGFVVNEKMINLFYYELHDIVENGKWSTKFDTSEAYENTEKRCAKIAKIAIPLFGIAVVYLIAVFLLTIFYMVQGNFDTNTWTFDQKMEVPLSSASNIFGWYLRTFTYALGVFTYCSIVSTIFPFVTGCSFYIQACCKHFEMIINDCDEINCSQRNSKAETIAEKMKCAVLFHMKILK